VKKQPDPEINTGIAKYQPVNWKNIPVSVHFGQQCVKVISERSSKGRIIRLRRDAPCARPP